MAKSLPLSLLNAEEEVPLPTFLPGEIVVARAENVLRFGAMTESKSGIAGVLYVTNFRVTFLTTSSSSKKALSSVFQSNPDLTGSGDIYADIQQELHVPLTCILEIYCDVKSFTGSRTKKMLPGSHVSSKVQVIEILCKDLRVLRFGLKFVPKRQKKVIVDAILHYAYPSAVTLVFAFSYSLASTREHDSDEEYLSAVPSFRNLPDWLNELSRLHVDDTWRVVDVNTKFQTCPSLSALFVCPSSLSDSDINRMSLHYIDARIPIWCWSHPDTGVPVLFSAAGRPESIFLEKEETSLFRLISSMAAETDHKGGGVKVIDVSKRCASIRDLQHSFLKLKTLCILDTTKSFWSIDPHWLSSLDSTRWLVHVNSSLTAALDVAQTVCDDGRPVIIKETSGRDLVFVVATLAQLILDSHYRTIRGFQSLLQRMWVLGGHPFTLRCGHIKMRTREIEKEEKEPQESPVFLHFLDCVFQLMNQFPSAFEFSETYLLGLFDALLSCMFDTFLLDSEHQRHNLSQSELEGKPMTSLWEFMTDHLSDSKTASVFTNPLYEFVSSVVRSEISSNGTIPQDDSYLKVNTSAAAMKFWSGFFLRWLPIVHVSAGLGENSSLHLQQMILMNEVKVLRYRLSVLRSDTNQDFTLMEGKPKELLNYSVEGDFESTVNYDLEATRLLTPSMPFIGDLSLNTYMVSAEIPTDDRDDSTSASSSSQLDGSDDD